MSKRTRLQRKIFLASSCRIKNHKIMINNLKHIRSLERITKQKRELTFA